MCTYVVYILVCVRACVHVCVCVCVCVRVHVHVFIYHICNYMNLCDYDFNVRVYATCHRDSFIHFTKHFLLIFVGFCKLYYMYVHTCAGASV